MLRGSVKTRRIGATISLRIERVTPAIISVVKPPTIVTPLNTFEAKNKASA